VLATAVADHGAVADDALPCSSHPTGAPCDDRITEHGTAGTLPGADRLVAAHPEATAIPLLTADEAFDAVPGTTLWRRDGRDLRDAPSPRPDRQRSRRWLRSK
jgi:hypothetical protein